MRAGFSTIIAISFTVGISIYLYKKIRRSLTSNMVTETIVHLANDEAPLHLKQVKLSDQNTDLEVTMDPDKVIENGVQKNNKIKIALNSSNISEVSGTEMEVKDLSSMTPEADIFHIELMSHHDSQIQNGQCNNDQGHVVQTSYLKDDCEQEMPLPLYEDLNNHESYPELQPASDLSSNCSSMSPVNGVSAKGEDTSGQTSDNSEEAKSSEVEAFKPAAPTLNWEAEPFVQSAKSWEPVDQMWAPIDQMEFQAPVIMKQPLENDFEKLYSEDFVHCMFNIPNVYVGKLLGKRGRFVQKIYKETGVSVNIDEVIRNDCKSCYIKGEDSKVRKALLMVEKLFPINSFPDMAATLNEINLLQTSPQNKITVCIGNNGGMAETHEMYPVKVTGISSVNCLYVQVLNHHMYPQLALIEKACNDIYSKYKTPNIPFPCSIGSFCVGFVHNEWQRCEVVQCRESTVVVFLSDKGITTEVDPSKLKRPLTCLTKVPSLALQVFLHGIQVPSDNPELIVAGNEWLGHTVSSYETIASIVGRDFNETPIINLFAVREYSVTGLVNTELVALNFAHNSATNTIVRPLQ